MESNDDERFKKMELLIKMGDLERMGAKINHDFDINSSLEELQFKYEFVKLKFNLDMQEAMNKDEEKKNENMRIFFLDFAQRYINLFCDNLMTNHKNV